RNLAKLNLGMPMHVQGLSAGVELRLSGKRETLVPGAKIPGFGVVNFNLLYEPAHAGWWLSGGLEDAFDRAYVDPVGYDAFIEMPRDRIAQFGRSWFAELGYRF